jgi:hypothetical protein
MAWQAPVRFALLAVITLLVVACTQEPTHAPNASSYHDPAAYCAAVGTIDAPDARYGGPSVPDWVARALRKATHGAPDAPLDFFKHAAWRCADGQVLACSFGANIPCASKAEMSRQPGPGAFAFCREHPDTDVVPAYATGHETVYEWRCRAGQPEIVRQLLAVDAQGFQTAFWYRVTPEMGMAE